MNFKKLKLSVAAALGILCGIAVFPVNNVIAGPSNTTSFKNPPSIKLKHQASKKGFRIQVSQEELEILAAKYIQNMSSDLKIFEKNPNASEISVSRKNKVTKRGLLDLTSLEQDAILKSITMTSDIA